MTRPVRINVPAGDNSWESQLNTNLQQIYDRPFPPVLHVGTLASLESARPAAQYQYCIAIVDYDGAGTPGQHVAFSNGTAWKLASNWELFQRRTFRVVTGTDSAADIDDTIMDIALVAVAEVICGEETNDLEKIQKSLTTVARRRLKPFGVHVERCSLTDIAPCRVIRNICDVPETE